ncbi:MAG TPA: hypothetical protein VM286_04980 [Candidatus Thermoplasmatota archaeon]|nr:hypothetical protein [Candidatus Thermoplasmatota archaeon]
MDARVLCVLLVAPLLAGCVSSCDPVPPVSARGIGPGTPSRGGTGSYSANITITQEPGGPGLAGAGVVFFWGDEDDAAARRGERSVVHVGAEGGAGNAEVDVSLPTASPPDYTTTLPLRTDAKGTVLARLPANRIVGFVAAADGWTEEWIPALATGSEGELRIAMPLYRERLVLDLQGTLSPGAASTAAVNQDVAWYPQDARLGSAAGATAGYLARLIRLDATLNWTNAPLSFGDLALAAGPEAGDPTLVRDADTDATLGARTQTLEVAGSDVRDRGLLGASHLHIGPATQTAYVGPMGVPYTLHVALTMDRAQAFRQSCAGDSVHVEQHSSPGAGLWLAAALLGAAFLARRRG